MRSEEEAGARDPVPPPAHAGRPIDPAALPLDPEQAARHLEALDEAEAQVLVDRLVDARESRRLAEMSPRLARKALVKVVRRGLHRLRSLGVVVPEPDAPHLPRSTLLAPVEEEDLSGGYAGMPGPEGDRVVLVLSMRPAGEYLFLNFLVREDSGIERMEALEFKRRDARRLSEGVARDLDDPMADVGVPGAARIVLDAVLAGEARSNPPPRDFLALRSDIQRMAQDAASAMPEPPPMPLARVRELARRSGELHQRPAFRVWVPAMEDLDRCRLHLDEVLASRLVLNDAQREDQIAAVFERDTLEFVERIGRDRLAARLRAGAGVLAMRGEDEAAEMARAASLELEAGENPPFFVDMFRKLMRISGPRGRAGPEGEAVAEVEGEGEVAVGARSPWILSPSEALRKGWRP